MNTDSRIGVLAYGSLLANPGWELEEAIERRIEDVQTPFDVEYARKSSKRAGAPTLVPVPDGKGKPVQAQIFVLKPDVDEQVACDILYRREINSVGDESKAYNDTEQREKDDAVVIERVEDFGGVAKILYATLKANNSVILQDDLSREEKAAQLAAASIESVTGGTYSAGRDGIRYLADAIHHGIQTPLTSHYKQAIMQRVEDASCLEEARAQIARARGILPSGER